MDHKYSPIVVSRSDSTDPSESDYEGERRGTLVRDEDVVAIPALKLNPDCYDGLILALCAERDREYKRKHGGRVAVRLQVVAALCKHIFSLFAQALLVLLLYSTSIRKMEMAYLNESARQMRTLLSAHVQAGTQLNVTNAQEKQTLDFCVQDNTSEIAHFVVEMLWLFKMVGELSQTLEILWRLLRLPPSPEESPDTIFTVTTTDKYIISYLPLTTKILIMLLVSIPHVVLALFLMWTGSKFLMVTKEMNPLIFKAVGLSYVVTLDELIFSSMTGSIVKDRLASTQFAQGESPSKWQVRWHLWGRTLLKAAVIFFGADFMQNVCFKHVHELRYLCREYLRLFPSANCPGCGLSLAQLVSTSFGLPSEM